MEDSLFFFVKEVGLVLEKYKNVKLAEYQIVFQNILKRHYYSIKAISILYPGLVEDSNIKFPIAIQFRVALLDLMTMIYLLSKDINEPKVLGMEMARFNKSTAKEIKKSLDEYKSNSNEELTEIINTHFPYNFDKDFNLNKKISDIKVLHMEESIKNSAAKKYLEAQKLYSLFSKYEHFSNTSIALLNQNPIDDYNRFHNSAHLIYKSSITCMMILQVEDIFIENFSNGLEKFEMI